MMTAKDLLKQAKILKAQPLVDLVSKVRELGRDLRNVHGFQILESDYHKAARIYNEDLLPLVMEDLHPSETNCIQYNHDLT